MMHIFIVINCDLCLLSSLEIASRHPDVRPEAYLLIFLKFKSKFINL